MPEDSAKDLVRRLREAASDAHYFATVPSPDLLRAAADWVEEQRTTAEFGVMYSGRSVIGAFGTRDAAERYVAEQHWLAKYSPFAPTIAEEAPMIVLREHTWTQWKRPSDD